LICSGFVAPSYKTAHKHESPHILQGAAHDTCRNVLVNNSPSEREVAHAAAQLLGNFGEPLDLLDLCLALGRCKPLDPVLEETLVGGEARVVRDTVVVLAGEDPTFERGPNGAAILATVKKDSLGKPGDGNPPAVTLVPPQWLVLVLEPLAVEHTVVWLLADGADHVEPAGDLNRLLYLHCEVVSGRNEWRF
jgi:hypothetical protein